MPALAWIFICLGGIVCGFLLSSIFGMSRMNDLIEKFDLACKECPYRRFALEFAPGDWHKALEKRK